MTASQCCAAQCNGGVCGPPTCPTDGTACGDCIASNCCAQSQACLDDPVCNMELHCELGCVKNGGSLPTCFQMCGGNPQTIQAGICAFNNCGGGICL
jgi:hypothetical protein